MTYPLGVIILTAADARRLLGIAPSTLRSWAVRGHITRVRRGEYDMGEIMNYLEKRGTRGQHHP